MVPGVFPTAGSPQGIQRGASNSRGRGVGGSVFGREVYRLSAVPIRFGSPARRALNSGCVDQAGQTRREGHAQEGCQINTGTSQESKRSSFTRSWGLCPCGSAARVLVPVSGSSNYRGLLSPDLQGCWQARDGPPRSRRDKHKSKGFAAGRETPQDAVRIFGPLRATKHTGFFSSSPLSVPSRQQQRCEPAQAGNTDAKPFPSALRNLLVDVYDRADSVGCAPFCHSPQGAVI